MIILDTDAVTFLQRRQSAVSQRLQNSLTALSADEEVVTTVITYEEQTRGWIAFFSQAKNPESIVAAYDRLLFHVEMYKKIEIVPYTMAAESRLSQLRGLKIRIGTRDLRIAAIALSLGATLFSRNLRDFGKVPELVVKDWTKL